MALGVQVYQVNQNASLQREANEATNLREALKLAGSKELPQAHAGTVLLSSMFHSPAYASTARAMALAVLSHMADPKSFEILLRDVMNATDWANLPDVVTLSRTLGNALGETRTRQDQINGGGPPLRHDEPDPALLEPALNEQTGLVGRSLTAFIRTRRRPSNRVLDISGANLSGQDLAGANLSGAIVTDVVFNEAALTAVDLSAVHEFKGSSWNKAEWWEADRIAGELLTFLEKDYGCKATERNCDAYNRSIARLRAGVQTQAGGLTTR